MKATILQGDVFSMLPTIKAGSVDCAVTSVPYWMLRSYLPKDHPLKHLELGSEKTPEEYIKNQVKVARLVRECLADHGTYWLNIGDTYSHAPGKRKTTDKYGAKQLTNGFAGTTGSASADLDAGSLCLIPWKLAIALQADGWIIRSIVCWQKPAPMPASITGWRWVKCRVKIGSGDRMGSGKQAANRLSAGLNEQTAEKKAFTSDGKPHGARDANGKDFASHAQWQDCPGCKKCESTAGLVLRKGSWRPTSSYEPILMLAKNKNYFCDGDAVRQPSAAATISRNLYSRIIDDPDEQFAVRHDHESTGEGANLRDVWKEDLQRLSKEELIALIEGSAAGQMIDKWRIAAEPLKEGHYAAYPTKLVENCLLAGTSSRGYCVACGKPWVRVVKTEPNPSKEHNTGDDMTGGAAKTGNAQTSKGLHRNNGNAQGPPAITTGWRASCTCRTLTDDTRPGLVLDPFAGSGRTALAARRLGLNFVGCELNEEYATMAERILYEDAPLFS